MARSEARISVAIWDDTDFLALEPGPQRLFLFLVSQRDLTHDGVLALRERRWSKSAAGLTRDDIERDLQALAAARFVVVDEDAEELLIRSFIRRDKVYRQPNVLRAAQDHLEVVTSPTIRAALAAELRRVLDAPDIGEASAGIVAEMLKGLGNPSGNPSPDPSGGVREGSGDGIAQTGNVAPDPEVLTADEPSPDDQQASNAAYTDGKQSEVVAGRNPSGNPSANPSGNPTRGAPGDRGVVTVVTTGFPVPRSPESPNPEPLSSPPATKTRAGARDIAEADANFDEFWATYPRRESKRTARAAWDRAVKRATPAEIIAGAVRYRDRPGREAKFTAMPATWLNGDRWTDDPATGRVTTRDGHYQPFTNPSPADIEAAYGGTL